MNHPSQLCQHCDAKGWVRELLGEQIPCPTCEGWGKVTLKTARRYKWKIVHRPQLKTIKTMNLFAPPGGRKMNYRDAELTV